MRTATTSLHVDFPSEWSGWRGKEYDLNLVPGSVLPQASSAKGQRLPSDLHVQVEPKAIGDIYCDAPVFRGAFVQQTGFKDGNTWSKNSSVILKFALRDDFIEDLVDEARMYAGPLQSLQGSVVPRVYGLYLGSSDEGDPVACLALECWGEAIQQPFSTLPVEARLRILQGLGAIHSLGVLHGDFSERNVLQKDGDIRIIDFGQSTLDHDCHCDMNFHPGETRPDEKQFGCSYMWDICRYSMRLWVMQSVPWINATVNTRPEIPLRWTPETRFKLASAAVTSKR